MANAAYKAKLGVTKIEKIHRFRFTLQGGKTRMIDFIPADNMPGFSHRVALDGVLTSSYLGAQFPPNQTNALDMLDILLSRASC